MNNAIKVLNDLVISINNYHERSDVKASPDTRPSDDEYLNAFSAATDFLNGEPDTMNRTYGEALEALKEGKAVSRVGWNGKGMFLFMRPEGIVPVAMVKTLPEYVKNYYGIKQIQEVVFTGYLCMKTADDSIVNGWLASQTDMLSNDWCILN